ncbi:Mth938-like domain-containing protein [Yinghuangia soli]|uniref:Mth938-like domain-containing protein n=1 Tax=Yinghuangia soli TaxID=2908204 RepID=A0AA41Q1V1_9ACTN|nr:Mth938-like domain-containing protein [Yinghuangia soli]MCF2530033.1 Mth938-like domain-containing protein [Yinghuangia soli]
MTEISARSPRITHLAWDELDAEGLGRHKDLKAYPGGGRAWDWDETGTRHSPGVQIADVEELLEHGCDIVVLSRGMDLRLEVPAETTDFLDAKGIEWRALETREAVAAYNELAAAGRAVGALVHSTC